MTEYLKAKEMKGVEKRETSRKITGNSPPPSPGGGKKIYLTRNLLGNWAQSLVQLSFVGQRYIEFHVHPLL